MKPPGVKGGGRGKSDLSRRSMGGASGDLAVAEVDELELAAAAAAADGDDDGLLADVAAMTGDASGQDAIARLEARRRPVHQRLSQLRIYGFERLSGLPGLSLFAAAATVSPCGNRREVTGDGSAGRRLL